MYTHHRWHGRSFAKEWANSSAVAGCDRVAANGDTANKIGIHGLAVLCQHHDVPFYIAMPTTTLDRDTLQGKDIVIEERDPTEVRNVQGHPIAPVDIPVWNPSFDVTDAKYITGWVTEKEFGNYPSLLCR